MAMKLLTFLRFKLKIQQFHELILQQVPMTEEIWSIQVKILLLLLYKILLLDYNVRRIVIDND